MTQRDYPTPKAAFRAFVRSYRRYEWARKERRNLHLNYPTAVQQETSQQFRVRNNIHMGAMWAAEIGMARAVHRLKKEAVLRVRYREEMEAVCMLVDDGWRGIISVAHYPDARSQAWHAAELRDVRDQALSLGLPVLVTL